MSREQYSSYVWDDIPKERVTRSCKSKDSQCNSQKHKDKNKIYRYVWMTCIQTFCPKLLSAERTFDLLFSHFCYIKSQLTYLICSYMRRLSIQNSLKCTGTLQIFINPHWYFILNTRLILCFIYIQTCVNVKAYAFEK